MEKFLKNIEKVFDTIYNICKNRIKVGVYAILLGPKYCTKENFCEVLGILWQNYQENNGKTYCCPE